MGYNINMKNKKIIITSIIVLILVIVFISIYISSKRKNSAPLPLVKDEFSGPALSNQIIEEGITSGNVEAGVHIFKDRGELSEFWKKINFSRPSVSLPEINFDKKTVIAFVSEEKPTGGYYLHLEKVEKADDGIKIIIKENIPGSKCFNTEIITQPFSLFIIEKTNEKISVETEKNIQNCN